MNLGEGFAVSWGHRVYSLVEVDIPFLFLAKASLHNMHYDLLLQLGGFLLEPMLTCFKLL